MKELMDEWLHFSRRCGAHDFCELTSVKNVKYITVQLSLLNFKANLKFKSRSNWVLSDMLKIQAQGPQSLLNPNLWSFV